MYRKAWCQIGGADRPTGRLHTKLAYAMPTCYQDSMLAGHNV